MHLRLWLDAQAYAIVPFLFCDKIVYSAPRVGSLSSRGIVPSFEGGHGMRNGTCASG